MTGDSFEKIKKGFKETGEGVKEGLEDTAEGVKDTAEKITDSDTYTGSDEEKKNREYNQAGGKEPMKPEDIAAHEPTAVKRDQDTEIAEGGQTGTDSPQAQEKYRKKGMTEAK
jgi:hypothetical protein